MKTRFFVATLGVALLAVPLLAQEQIPSNESPSEGRGTDCTYNFANGGANGMSWCVSANGTMPKFASPVANEHIRVGSFTEGWLVCSGTTVVQSDLSAFSDVGNGGSLLLSGPSGTGVKVRRFPAAGRPFQVDNQYKADVKENDVTITMTVKNVGPATVSNVWITRMYDPDIDGDFGDDIHDRSVRAVWAREGNGLTLTPTTFNTFAFSAVGGPLDCTSGGVATPTGPSDPLVKVSYFVGNMNPGVSKKVVFVYERH